MFKALLSKVHSLFSEEFIRNVLTLMAGSVIAQGIALVSAPIITRLYSTSQFGIYGLFYSTVSILSIGVCLCYELAIVLPDKDEDAGSLLVGAALVAAIMSLLFLLVFAISRESLANMLNAPKLGSYLLWAPFSLFLIGLYQALTYWFTRRKEFRTLSVSRISRNFGMAAGQIGSASALPVGSGGLIGGFITGQILSLGILFRQFRSEMCHGNFFNEVNIRHISDVFYRYRKFPLLSSWSSFLNILSLHMPLFFLTYFFGISTAGLFELSNRVVLFPSVLVGTAVTQVYFEEAAANLKNKGTLSRLVESLTTRLIQIIAIPVVVLCSCSPALFSFIFGEQWHLAGQIAQILALALAVQFVILPLSMTLLILELQHIVAFWKVLYLVSQATILLVSGNYLGVLGVMVCYSVGNIVLYGIYGYFIFKYSGAQFLASIRGIFDFRAPLQKGVP